MKEFIWKAIRNFALGLADDFKRNFITDNRWKYIVDGLETTLLVTFLALVLGVVLGFLVAIIRATHDKTNKLKIFNAICNLYITVIINKKA